MKYNKKIAEQLSYEELTSDDYIVDYEELKNTNHTDDLYQIDTIDINYLCLEDAFADVNLYKAFKSLSLVQKRILFLIYIEDKDEEDIANILNITRQAVNKSKNIAIKKVFNLYLTYSRQQFGNLLQFCTSMKEEIMVGDDSLCKKASLN